MFYVLIILLAGIAIVVDCIGTRRVIKRTQEEVEKTKIFAELMELNLEYRVLHAQNMLDGFPHIVESMKEIPQIIRAIGFEIDLNRITVVPVQIDSEQMKKLDKLKEENKYAPQEVKELLKRKIHLVNKIGIVKHPWTSLINILTVKFSLNLILMVLRVVIFVLNGYSGMNRFFGRGIPDSKKPIYDTYTSFG